MRELLSKIKSFFFMNKTDSLRITFYLSYSGETCSNFFIFDPHDQSLVDANQSDNQKRMETVQTLKRRGTKYEEVPGVSLKEDSDAEIIMWSTEFTVDETAEAARRLLAKYRNENPNDVSFSKFKRLLLKVEGFSDRGMNDGGLIKILSLWKVLHHEEIEKITFEHLSSYEP